MMTRALVGVRKKRSNSAGGGGGGGGGDGRMRYGSRVVRKEGRKREILFIPFALPLSLLPLHPFRSILPISIDFVHPHHKVPEFR